MKAYFAGPLFTLAEKQFNLAMKRALEARVDGLCVDLPQLFGDPSAKGEAFLESAFHHCIRSVESCDIMIAVLEGTDADSGTCIEMGYAHALKKPIIGFRTDTRQQEDHGLNLMVARICSKLVLAPGESDPAKLADLIAAAVEEL